MSKRLLLCLAHPDDESFGFGGLIAKYVAEGVDVYLVCSTNGDVGTVSPEHMNGYKTIAELRLAELDCASTILGFKHVYKLGFKDSGMMTDETIHDPACSWYTWQNDPDKLIRPVVNIIREIKPQVVMTFNRYGGYGHPDHIAIQRATVEAFALAADPHYETDGLPPFQPQKLYYNRFPTLLLRLAILWMRLRGQNPRKMGRNNDIDMQKILDHVEPAHARIDIRDYGEIWMRANACHASQGGGMGNQGNLVFRLMRRWLARYQQLTRVHPAPEHDKVDETDVFFNVNLSEPIAETAL